MIKFSYVYAALASLVFSGCSKPAVVSNEIVETSPDQQDERESDESTSRSVVKLTDAAIDKFVAYLKDTPGNHIRLSMNGDESAGFTYSLNIESPPWSSDDLVDSSHGFAIVVSPRDSLYLYGTTIDWETRPDGTEGFKFHNPNAVED